MNSTSCLSSGIWRNTRTYHYSAETKGRVVLEASLWRKAPYHWRECKGTFHILPGAKRVAISAKTSCAVGQNIAVGHRGQMGRGRKVWNGIKSCPGARRRWLGYLWKKFNVCRFKGEFYNSGPRTCREYCDLSDRAVCRPKLRIVMFQKASTIRCIRRWRCWVYYTRGFIEKIM